MRQELAASRSPNLELEQDHQASPQKSSADGCEGSSASQSTSPNCPDELKPENQADQPENQELKQENEDLKQQLADSKKQSHSSATPFSKNKRQENPQKPGRKPGKGPFCRQEAPEPREQDEVQELEASLDSPNGPKCGTPLEIKESEPASIIDLPKVIGRVIKYFKIEVGVCPQCGHKVRGKHPELAEDQFGATAHRVGTQVYAWALALPCYLGLPRRQVAKVMTEFFSLAVTQSVLTQKALKAAESGRIGELAQEIKEYLMPAAVVHTDDTSWKVGGEKSWLMVFCN